MKTRAWNDGMTFVGKYKGIALFSKGGTIHCLFGWLPKAFCSIRAAKCAITRREKAS